MRLFKKNNDIQAYQDMLSRTLLATKMGMQFDGDRDLYKTFGYKHELTYSDYWSQYARQDIARAIIDRPAKATWRGALKITAEEKLEKEYKRLVNDLRLKEAFLRLDKLTCIGHYGVLFLGFDGSDAELSKPPQGNKKLLYVKPLSERAAPIYEYDTDSTSPRYGRPLRYNINVNMGGRDRTLQVHHTRILHVTGDLLEDEVKGTPVLKAVFNRLKDLEKLVGGSAEMFWKGARPGYQGKIDKDLHIDQGTRDKMKEQVDEYEHGLRRILLMKGVDMEALGTQVSDPKTHVDVQIEMISSITGIPKRILTGSERGELASSEDKTTWNEVIQTRREEYAETSIVRPFIDRCMQYGVLPEHEYEVEWKDLFAKGEQEQAETGKIRATALKEYMQNPAAEMVVPPEAFFKYFLGLDETQIEEISDIVDGAINEENNE